ncbi:ABC transporter permease [Kaistia dalseonensis]|uniref:Cell division transport system permease protein n=1 Tax=Kaistia dalseonensis TaxID=410840 RepID=A0ABU0H4D9_9HYPH|nr:ABC transporter permease [Kaistia dalseonensis]MCX5494589.1 ABC transporter permease [Kaistia dalseonensis]MDQ0437169.1 cell division transport system permease protein [Kaistia dalseonensis]
MPARSRRGQKSAGPGPIVPAQSIAGRSLTIVVAIMSFLACLTLGAVSLVRDASLDWQSDIVREITIQVRPVEGVDTDAEAAKASAIATAVPGVASARALSSWENAQLLEPWLGSGLDMSDLPIPRLIVVELSDPDGVDLAALSAQLQQGVKGASLDDHRSWTDRLKTMANATVIIGFSILALVFVATVLSVVFATRGAMASNRDIVAVLHYVGAEASFTAREFQRHFLLLGLKGGLCGAAGATILFAVLSFFIGRSVATPEGDQVSALFGRFAIGPTGYLGALAIAILIAIMTAITSRLTVYRHLASIE